MSVLFKFQHSSKYTAIACPEGTLPTAQVKREIGRRLFLVSDKLDLYHAKTKKAVTARDIPAGTELIVLLKK